MDGIKKIQQFFKYWTLRYLLVTELYMVEPWEKVVIHIVFAVFFGLFWYFNYTFVLSAVSHIKWSSTYVEQIL